MGSKRDFYPHMRIRRLYIPHDRRNAGMRGDSMGRAETKHDDGIFIR